MFQISLYLYFQFTLTFFSFPDFSLTTLQFPDFSKFSSVCSPWTYKLWQSDWCR